MKLKFLSLWVIIVLCFSISGVGQADTTNIEYRFAYLWSRSKFDVSLLAIDPTDANAPALPLQLLSDSDQYIVWSFSSPDGQWLTSLLIDDDQEGSRIFLQNTLTQETRFVTPHVDTLRQSWSPNSQYLLFQVPEGENAALAPGAYVYEVAGDSVTLLAAADDDLDPYAYEWSPDSSQILVVSHACIEGLCERIAARVAELHILDVPSGTRAAEDVFLSEGSRLCDFHWTPDGRRISFTFACEDFLGLDQYLREMWVWDSEGTEFEQITQFTQNFRRRSDIDPTRTYLPFYNSIWYDDEHLLVGLLAGEFSLPEGYRDYDEVEKSISVYEVDGELTTLSSDYVGEWAMNPVSGQVAYRIEQLVPFTNEDGWS